MNDVPPKKRTGRPAKPEAERKGSNLTFRTRADFRARLEEAAAKSGRSVTEEVERRVVRSFEVDQTIRKLDELTSVFIDNGETALSFATDAMALIASLQALKSSDGRQIGSEDWSKSVATRAGVREAIMILIDHFAPKIDEKEIINNAVLADDVGRARALAKVLAQMYTGQADHIIELVMRQYDA